MILKWVNIKNITHIDNTFKKSYSNLESSILTNKKQDNINICTEPAKESHDNSKWLNMINTSSSQIYPHLFTDEEDNYTIKIQTPTSNKLIVLNETN